MDIAEARKIHDTLLAQKPKDVDHDVLSCEFCPSPTTEQTASAEAVVEEVRREEPRMEPIHTQEATDALIESAVAKATEQAKVAHELQVSELTESLEKAKAEVAELQGKRDEDQISLAARDEEIVQLKGDISSRDEKSAREERMDSRVTEVAGVHKFSEDYVTANKERWAGMDDDSFASYVESIRDMASHIKPAETEATQVPEETAMSNVRTDTPAIPARGSFFSALKGGSK